VTSGHDSGKVSRACAVVRFHKGARRLRCTRSVAPVRHAALRIVLASGPSVPRAVRFVVRFACRRLRQSWARRRESSSRVVDVDVIASVVGIVILIALAIVSYLGWRFHGDSGAHHSCAGREGSKGCGGRASGRAQSNRRRCFG